MQVVVTVVARLIELIFLLFCLAVVPVLLVLFLADLVHERASKLVTVAGNTIVLLPLLAALPSWIIGVPPVPTLVLKEVDLFSGIQVFLVIVLTGFGVYLRALFYEGRTFQKVWAVAVQGVLGLLFFLLPFLWTIRDGRLTSSDTRSIEKLTPAPCPMIDSMSLLAQISDLHITSSGQPTREGAVPGNAWLGPILDAINEYHPAYLLITGDLTDSGGTSEWNNILPLLRKTNLQSTIVITPGNHDLNLAFGDEPSTFPTTDDNKDFINQLDQLPRIARVYAVQASLTPNIISRDGSKLAELLSNTPTRTTAASFSTQISECTDQCVNDDESDQGRAKARIGCYFACKRNWGHIRNLYLQDLADQFPWRWVDAQRQLAIVSIATTLGKTDKIGQNAIGEIDDAQLKALASELKEVSSNITTFVFIFHHPITNIREEDSSAPIRAGSVIPPLRAYRTTWERLQDSVWWARMFLRADPQEANKLLAVLDNEMHRRGNAHGIVMFGHRHMRTLGVWNNLTFVESPNVSHVPPDRGFYLVTTDATKPNVSWCPLARQ